MSRAQLTSTVEQNTGGAVSPYVAGKNAIINGGFDIWQRGTTFTVGTNTYTADRYIAFRSAYAAGMTVSRQLVNDSTNLPNIQYCARVQRDSGTTGTGNMNIQYSQETSNSIQLAGKTVTFSFYARAGANYSSPTLIAQVYTGTGTDQNIATSSYTGIATSISTTVTLTTTWQRFTATATLAGTTNEFALSFTNNPTGTAGAADYYEVTGVQLEIGSVATPFSRAGGTLSGELQACQRYFEVQDGNTNVFRVAVVYQATQPLSYYVNYVVQKRGTPSISWLSNGSARYVSATIVNSLTLSTISTSIYGTGVQSTTNIASAGSGWVDNSGLMLINAEL